MSSDTGVADCLAALAEYGPDAVELAVRTREAERFVQRMVDDGMLERVEGAFRPVEPKFWWPRPREKGFKARQRRHQMAWDRAKKQALEDGFADFVLKRGEKQGMLDYMLAIALEEFEGATLRDLDDPEHFAAVERKVFNRVMKRFFEVVAEHRRASRSPSPSSCSTSPSPSSSSSGSSSSPPPSSSSMADLSFAAGKRRP